MLRLKPRVIVWMVPKVGKLVFVSKTLGFVVEVVAGWVLSLVGLFEHLMWDMLFGRVAEGR
jgi:hypothetical protein